MVELDLSPVSAKLGIAVLTASLIGGGTAVLRNQNRLVALEARTEAIPEIRDDVRAANVRLRTIEAQLAVLIDRGAREDAHEPSN